MRQEALLLVAGAEARFPSSGASRLAEIQEVLAAEFVWKVETQPLVLAEASLWLREVRAQSHPGT